MSDHNGFWYLASPYTRLDHQWAFEEACKAAALLLECGVVVFSPIAHTHPIAIHGKLDENNSEFWEKADAPFVAMAKGIIVLKIDGWETSEGVSNEVYKIAGIDRKPIIAMEPGILPEEFM